MSVSNKLTLGDIENMDPSELSKLTAKDYKHLKSEERARANIIIKTSKGASNAHQELMGNGNTHVNGSESASTTISANEEVQDLNSIADKIMSATKNDKPKKFEDTHSKSTLWIRDDLMKVVNKISTKRGDKTKIINQALEEYILKLGNQVDRK